MQTESGALAASIGGVLDDSDDDAEDPLSSISLGNKKINQTDKGIKLCSIVEKKRLCKSRSYYIPSKRGLYS